MNFNHFINQFSAIADNTPFFVRYTSDLSSKICSTAKKAGITSVVKTTSLMAIKGAEYAKLNTTKEAVANGKVLTHQLTWGTWSATYKNIIEHKGNYYARLYFPEEKVLPKMIKATESHYFVNGVEMAKDELIAKGIMQNSAWAPKTDNCFNVNVANIEMIEA